MPLREYLGAYPEKDLRKAIDKAIEKCSPKGLHFCIREDVLREFLIRRRREMTKVTQLDYTFDRRIELERKDAIAEERVNTERERKAKEEALQEKEKERQRAEQAGLHPLGLHPLAYGERQQSGDPCGQAPVGKQKDAGNLYELRHGGFPVIPYCIPNARFL